MLLQLSPVGRNIVECCLNKQIHHSRSMLLSSQELMGQAGDDKRLVTCSPALKISARSSAFQTWPFFVFHTSAHSTIQRSAYASPQVLSRPRKGRHFKLTAGSAAMLEISSLTSWLRTGGGHMLVGVVPPSKKLARSGWGDPNALAGKTLESSSLCHRSASFPCPFCSP